MLAIPEIPRKGDGTALKEAQEEEQGGSKNVEGDEDVDPTAEGQVGGEDAQVEEVDGGAGDGDDGEIGDFSHEPDLEDGGCVRIDEPEIPADT